MGKIKSVLAKGKKKKVWIPLVIILLVVIYFATSGGPTTSGIDVIEVHKQAVSRTVSETGLVEPAKKLALGFVRGGRVDALPVSEGQSVKAGTLLASTGAGAERASLREGRARLQNAKNGVSSEDRRAAEASVEAAQVALENAKKHQELAVENALERFLNANLRAYLKDGNVGRGETDSAPVITGTYTSTERGKYVIELYSSNASSGSSFRYSFVNEDGETVEEGLGTVSTDRPEPLGDRGLYLEFPLNFATGLETTWIIPIPNERSSMYVTAKNAYQQTIETNESIVDAKRAALESARAGKARSLQAVSQYQLDALRASVDAAEIALSHTKLFSPIAGVIADISIDQGEIVGAGTPVITLLSDNAFSVSVDIPEADIVGLTVGDTAEVTFDAYDDLSLPAEVTFISPQAVTKQGVTSVEVELGFESADERLKSGITADVDIHTSEKKSVLALPSRAVIEMNEKKFVHILPDGVKKNMLTVKNIAEKLKKVPVSTGLRGTSGLVEITSGLSGGENVVTFLPEALRKALEDAPENKEK